MPAPDWFSILDIDLAFKNVQLEFYGDWHKDPWSWPEYPFLLTKDRDLIKNRLNGSGCERPSLISVPKENWGIRPAVVLDLLDRLCYQAIVDRHSVDMIGDLSTSVYGWRLIPDEPKAGLYAHDSMQWDNYRAHINDAASWYDAALKTDIVSCFASLSPSVVLDEVSSRAGKAMPLDRLGSFLEGFDRISARSGLPQRARPSSVLANMMLRHFDDVLTDYASEIPDILLPGERLKLSYVRWMDDMWLFGDDASKMRKAQLELQRVALDLGLHLNSSKTEVLEGDDTYSVAMELELSAVDTGLKSDDSHPLEELIERVLDSPDTAGRTQVKFMVSRMIKNNIHYRVDDLLRASGRMPHCADTLSAYFGSRYVAEGLQDWFLGEVSGAWALLQWPEAQYFGMFDSSVTPNENLLAYSEQRLDHMNTELPLLALAAQRLASWDPGRARSAISSALEHRTNPQEIRVLALAALTAGESKYMVRKWLKQEDANAPTLHMLEEYKFAAPKVSAKYATGGPAAT
jgi:hypothetical protein